MTDVQKNLDRAAAALRRKRIKIQRRIQEKLQEELLATDLARLEAGSGSGPASREKFGHRMVDRWAGFSDAIVGRHRLYDVVAAYKAALKDRAEQARLRVQSAKGLRRMSELGIEQDDDPSEADMSCCRFGGHAV